MIGDMAQQAHRDFLESRILSARPAERIQMLYQIALDSIRTAVEKLREGDVFARGRAINKAHEAIDELNFALDHSVGASFTHRLSELYLYVQRQLVKGHSQKSEQALEEALSVLTTLADTWKEVVVRTCGSSPNDVAPQAIAPKDSGAAEEGALSGAPQPLTAYAGFPRELNSRDWSG